MFFGGIHRKDRKMVQVQSKVRLMQGKCAFFQASCRYCMQIAVKMVKQAWSNGSALRKARPHNVWVPGAVRTPPLFTFHLPPECCWVWKLYKPQNATSNRGIIFGVALVGVNRSHFVLYLWCWFFIISCRTFHKHIVEHFALQDWLPLPHSLQGKNSNLSFCIILSQ